jgi:Domain of unknown function (DUF4421)
MKRILNICILVFHLFFLANTGLFAQEVKADSVYIKPFDKPERSGFIADSAYIRQFDKSNMLELYPGIFSTRFDFSDPHSDKSDYRLMVNSNGYTGVYFNYKWISLKYTWAMPGTSLDKTVKMNNISLSFRFTGSRTILHTFFDAYNGLLIPQKSSRNKYEPFRGITITDAGTDFYYFSNGGRYSPRAANFYSELQSKPAGSLFGMITPLWQKVNWISPSAQLVNDPDTYSLLSADPSWVSLIARIGYTYNMVFQNGRYNFAPAVVLGTGGLRELHTPDKTIKMINDFQAWVNAGYNGHNYYAYLNGSVSNLKTNLLVANMHEIKKDISFTIGYRFHSMKKKIFGIV